MKNNEKQTFSQNYAKHCPKQDTEMSGLKRTFGRPSFRQEEMKCKEDANAELSMKL